LKPVGILGGMGPAATILLMQKVLAAVPARDDRDHIPMIVHQNPGVPSRIDALIGGTGDDPGPVLAGMARDLARAGARALAMPCNTAHHYAPQISGATDLAFLNMLGLSAAHLSARGAKRVGMLASPAVRLTGVFDADFSAHGLRATYPEDDAAILSIIRAVKSGVAVDSASLWAQADALMGAGCDHVLVACTELSLLMPEAPRRLPITDSLDCLVDAIVAFAQS
jgi:aspartate racemase